MYRLKHADGKKHLSEYWLDDEFCVREWDTREEAEAFARMNDDCFKLVVVPTGMFMMRSSRVGRASPGPSSK